MSNQTKLEEILTKRSILLGNFAKFQEIAKDLSKLATNNNKITNNLFINNEDDLDIKYKVTTTKTNLKKITSTIGDDYDEIQIDINTEIPYIKDFILYLPFEMSYFIAIDKEGSGSKIKLDQDTNTNQELIEILKTIINNNSSEEDIIKAFFSYNKTKAFFLKLNDLGLININRGTFGDKLSTYKESIKLKETQDFLETHYQIDENFKKELTLREVDNLEIDSFKVYTTRELKKFSVLEDYRHFQKKKVKLFLMKYDDKKEYGERKQELTLTDGTTIIVLKKKNAKGMIVKPEHLHKYHLFEINSGTMPNGTEWVNISDFIPLNDED